MRYDVKGHAQWKLMEHIKDVLREMGYDDGRGNVYTQLEYAECGDEDKNLNVVAVTYVSSTDPRNNHEHNVKIPWELIFNYDFRSTMKADEIKAFELEQLRRLKLKYPDHKLESEED